MARGSRQPVSGQRGCAAPESAAPSHNADSEPQEIAPHEQLAALAEAPGRSADLFGQPKRKAKARIAYLKKHPDKIGRVEPELEELYRLRSELRELACDLARLTALGNATGAAARERKAREFERMATFFRTIADNPETEAQLTKPLDETIWEFRLVDDARFDPRAFFTSQLLVPSRKRGGRRKSFPQHVFRLCVLEIAELWELDGEDPEKIFAYIVKKLNSNKINVTRSTKYPKFTITTIKTWRRNYKTSTDYIRMIESCREMITEGWDPAALAKQRMSELLFNLRPAVASTASRLSAP